MTAVALAALVLRIVGGGIFIAQGSRKLFAPADAPHGLANLQAMIGRRLPRAAALAYLVAATELLGGAALVLGVLTRLVILPLAAVLVAAIVGWKWQQGFLGGWDWPLSVLAILVAIGLLGAGPVSVDSVVGLS